MTEVPPYYDRFIEERDRRIAAELHELRALVGINTQQIEELRADLLRGFEEARKERRRIESKMDTQFRWTVGLLMSIVVGILVVIVRVFFGLP